MPAAGVLPCRTALVHGRRSVAERLWRSSVGCGDLGPRDRRPTPRRAPRSGSNSGNGDPHPRRRPWRAGRRRTITRRRGPGEEPAYDENQRQLLELEVLAAATPPGREEPGLIAWTQRAFHHPGYFPPTCGQALAGLILWPVVVLAVVATVVVISVVNPPPYPNARTELVARSLVGILLLTIAWLACYTAMSYWRTRPVRVPRSRRNRQRTRSD